ncbi:Ribonuclease HII [Eubacterium plexicaudatum ASF492]|uniref:Ribonuclease HII n=1 Tax=Eubacterium plexicaudatum ASF492 TaxID=1235802 RepID=N2A007_9FIRM|nr:Ribonuclease HII [Eubacterium plexicaudatum ASF492]
MSEDSVQKTIAQIREEYQAAQLQMLPEFISAYRQDTRAGVQKLTAQAERKLQKLEEERARMVRMTEYERQYAAYTYVCGVDEAGRGPLAGPVVAGAVVFPKDCELLYINDSKQLSAAMRTKLFSKILSNAVASGVGLATAETIDEINILQATYQAMREAINNLGIIPDILLNDAITIPDLRIRQVPIIKGDAKSMTIAAASILAKVTRDRMMEEYDRMYPGYGFAAHKGYGTKEHIQALRKLGPCDIHRKTFIKSFL